MTFRHRNDPARRGFLVYKAIGDAHGMAYEFADDIAAVGRVNLTYRDNPKYAEYQKAHYTDDTQMEWPIAEIMLHFNTASMTPSVFADAWARAYRNDPRPGYGRRMQEVLARAGDGLTFLNLVDPTKGITSGSAMRATVIGLLPDARTVKDIAARQAKITHDTPTGVLAAQAAALAVHGLHYNLCRKADLVSYIDGEIGSDWRTLDTGGHPGNGLHIVRKAVDAVIAADSMRDLLKRCIEPGQDTDTISAIAMPIASRTAEIADDLPHSLFRQLENEDYGRDFLEKLDRQLLDRFPPPPRPLPQSSVIRRLFHI